MRNLMNTRLFLIMVCACWIFVSSCKSNDDLSSVPEEEEKKVEWLLTEVIKYSEGGNQDNPDAKLTLVYDTLNRPVEVREETRSADGFVNLVTKHMVYNEKEQIIKMKTVGGIEAWNDNFAYNEKGELQRVWHEATPVETIYSYDEETIVGDEILRSSRPERPVDTNRTIYTFGPDGNMSHLKIHRIKGEDSSVSAEIDVEFTNYNQHPNPWASVNIGDLHMWEIFDAVYQRNREPSLIDKMPFLSVNSPYSISITSTNQYNSEPEDRYLRTRV